jgi:hypothetical protein
MVTLLTKGDASAKLAKGQGEQNYLTAVLYLKPADSSGIAGVNLCPAASAGCKAGCLNTAGRGADHMKDKKTGVNLVQRARQERTELLIRNPAAFHDQLKREIRAFVAHCNKKGMKPAIRLNGTSDINWTDVYREFPDVQFYEYTKRPDLAIKLSLLPNVSVTFSLSEVNFPVAIRMLGMGINVAVVFSAKRGKPLPTDYHYYRVIDGDLTDNRFLDPTDAREGYVIGLRAKGKAIKDTSGFVQQVGACVGNRQIAS